MEISPPLAQKDKRIRAMAIVKTAAAFFCSPDWVRKVARGTEVNEEIKAYYNQAYSDIKKVMKT